MTCCPESKRPGTSTVPNLRVRVSGLMLSYAAGKERLITSAEIGSRVRCRANLAHTRQSGTDYGLGMSLFARGCFKLLKLFPPRTAAAESKRLGTSIVPDLNVRVSR